MQGIDSWALTFLQHLKMLLFLWMSFSNIRYPHLFCFRVLLCLNQALQKSNWIR
jgi:hypothetical protein